MKTFKILKEWLGDASERIGDPVIKRIFKQCYLNTLETTTEFLPDGTTYIFTGDIPAMWLRDSNAQVSHYIPLCNFDADVKAMVKGLIKRQAMYVKIDPYANAFNKGPDGSGAGNIDYPIPDKWVWERKYEVDSLCSFLDLAVKYYNETGDNEIFDKEYFAALNTVMDVFSIEQYHNEKSDYSFIRTGEFSLDTLLCGGKGGKAGYTGMTWSGFRPSDDRCEHGYLIPANLFAAKALKNTAAVLPLTEAGREAARRAVKLSGEIEQGVYKYGVTEHQDFGRIFAYETDGLGNYIFMDDANVPSLLSLPYLECCPVDDKIYQNTRRFILSGGNPYYYEGKYARGIGSPHTPENHIWHISLIIQAMTARNDGEKEEIISWLKNTHAGAYYMHESFDKDNPHNFTREWFAWANSLFAEFIMRHYGLCDTSAKKNELRKIV